MHSEFGVDSEFILLFFAHFLHILHFCTFALFFSLVVQLHLLFAAQQLLLLRVQPVQLLPAAIYVHSCTEHLLISCSPATRNLLRTDK